MVGVSEKTKRGMWAVVENYFKSNTFQEHVDLTYIPTATVFESSKIEKITYFLSAYRRISQIIKCEKPNIVHLHVSEKGSVYRKKMIAVKANRAGAKVVLHMHGGSFFKFYKEGNDRDRRITQQLLLLSDVILVLGEAYKEQLCEIGAPCEKIVIVPNGVDVSESNPYEKTSNEIIYMGGITQEKGILDLLDAVKTISDSFPEDASVWLYGPLSSLDINEEISIRGLGDKVFYGGVVSGSKKSDVLSRAGYSILPSHFEVLPMAVLETMAQGIPTLSTKVGMVEDIIKDGLNGFLCLPNNVDNLTNSITSLLSLSDARRKSVSQCAYETVAAHFSTEVHIDRILAVYDELLSSKSDKDE